MAVRAHRINKLQFNNESSFSLWDDEEIVSFLKENGNCPENIECNGGIIEVSIKELKEMKKRAKSKEAKKAIQRDIEYAKKHKKDWLLFYCY